MTQRAMWERERQKKTTENESERIKFQRPNKESLSDLWAQSAQL